MDMLKPILERRSHRSFLDKPVPEDVLENLLKAGMFAPSAMNSQPCEFLIMKDDDKRSRVSELMPVWNMLKNAPLGILVLANTNGYRASTKEFIVQDCAACTENILLAAHAMGLGSCLIGFAVAALKRDRKIKQMLKIPAEEEIYSVIALGYPDEKYQKVAGRKTVIPRYPFQAA